MIRACLVIVLIMVIVNSGIKPTHADDSTALRRPITALWADPAGSRLLIGRGTMLILAEVTPTAVVVTHEIPLERGIIGGVGMTAQGILVALTERGIFTLTPDRVIIDNLPGGGNTLRIVGDQILIAALDGGVRLAQISPTGVITLLGELKPQGKAFSAALDVNQAHVWVAEGAAGVHAYALQGGAPLTTLNDVTNADQVLRDGTLLYVAGSGTLYVFDLATGTPRLQTRLSLEPTTKPEGASAWVVSDMLAIGSRLYIGRYAGNGQGADALIIDLTATSATLTGQIGISGSGEHLALRGDDLFVGSV
ncbi:MAG TPA: hypothetical protein PLD47_15835, partial [Aggregatilineales bacterium]|nr:hypothetical protein [Aggregatilineales bacterium]